MFIHAQRGQPAVASFLRSLLRGLAGFAIFCVVFSAALGPLHTSLTMAVALALAAQIAVQFLILLKLAKDGVA